MNKMEAAKVLLKFGADLGMSVERSLADGKLDLADSANFFPVLMNIGNVIEASKIAPKALGEYTSAEVAELSDYLDVTLDLANDKLESLIEKSFLMVTSVMELVNLAKNLKKVATPVA